MKDPKKLVVKNISKSFFLSKNVKIDVVKNISFTLKPGEFITLLGPSGCGKTTLLRIIAGFEKNYSGDVYIGKELVTHLEPNQRDTALVFQKSSLFPNLNVYENIAYGLRIRKKDNVEIESKVRNILDLLNIKELDYRFPHELSEGQKQKVVLARTLVIRPSILLFDEPLSNLDYNQRKSMREEIRQIQKKIGTTTLYVTHDQKEALGISDRMIIMRDGKIEQFDTSKKIYQKPVNAFVGKFVGKANIISGYLIIINDKSYSVKIGDIQFTFNGKCNKKIGEKLLFLIRPEQIQLDMNMYMGKLIQKIYFGPTVEYLVEWKKNIINIVCPNTQENKKYNVGEYISFGFLSKALHILM